jgi:alcohol dehydrogenase
MIMKDFTFFCPTRIVFTASFAACIEGQLRNMGAERPLLVTDKVMLDHPQVLKLRKSLESAGFRVTIFGDVMPDPSTLIVEAGVKAYQGGSCDSILAVGGGSTLDTARGVGIVVSNGGQIEDYEGWNKFTKRLPYFIAVPTTAGTGSENSSGSVITHDKRKVKMTVFGDLGSPDVAVLAPELIVKMPPYVAAASGMDALTHAVEAVLGRKGSIYSEVLALQAIEIGFKNLNAFVQDTDNLELAAQMIMCSDIAGMACVNAGLGLVHAMAHPLGAHTKRPHGEICAVLLPHVMKFNISAETAERYRKIAGAMGIDGDSQSAPLKTVDAIVELNKKLGIKQDYKDLHVTDDIKDIMVKDTLVSGSAASNPVRATSDDVYGILNAIL